MRQLITKALDMTEPGEETHPLRYPNERAAIEAGERLEVMIEGAECAWARLRADRPPTLVVKVRQRIEKVPRSAYTLGAAGSPDWDVVIAAI